MTAQQAAKRLEKLLGPKGIWRVDDSALREEQKPTADESRSAHAAKRMAMEACEARAKQLLANDEEYQRLRGVRENAKRVSEGITSKRLGFRITVGVDNGGWMSVKAQGDNWAEVIAKLEAEAK